MLAANDLASLAGKTMTAQDGSKIGKVVDVYESTDGPEATFVTVSTGLFGGGASFVPLAEADLQGNNVVVPYSKDLVKDAPRVEPDQELTSAEEARLYQHYSLGAPTGAAATTAPVATAPVAAPVSAAQTETARTGTTDDAMTRSEERLHVGTQQVETGRAKLRKRIVTEAVSTTVPVQHERAVITTEPITEANRDKAMDGPVMTEAVHEVVLHDEKPVVSKETVAVERVRLDTQTVTENVQVNEQVRKEQIELDDSDLSARGDDTPRRS